MKVAVLQTFEANHQAIEYKNGQISVRNFLFLFMGVVLVIALHCMLYSGILVISAFAGFAL